MSKIKRIRRRFEWLSERHRLMPPASHCSKVQCFDWDCPVTQEMQRINQKVTHMVWKVKK